MTETKEVTLNSVFDPDALKSADIAYGNWLFAQPCSFDLSVVAMGQLPPAERMEVAFAGRSNVGKSSLLNALINQRDMARTSSTPGRTQQLNFFDLGETLCLVDLPGYGYAKAPKQNVEAWTKLTNAFLKGRPTLARVYILIDSRHGLKENDKAIMSALDKVAVSYQLVLTKSDKISAVALERVLAETSAEALRHPACHPITQATSSAKKIGLDTLKADVGLLERQMFPEV